MEPLDVPLLDDDWLVLEEPELPDEPEAPDVVDEPDAPEEEASPLEPEAVPLLPVEEESPPDAVVHAATASTAPATHPLLISLRMAALYLSPGRDQSRGNPSVV